MYELAKARTTPCSVCTSQDGKLFVMTSRYKGLLFLSILVYLSLISFFHFLFFIFGTSNLFVRTFLLSVYLHFYFIFCFSSTSIYFIHYSLYSKSLCPVFSFMIAYVFLFFLLVLVDRDKQLRVFDFKKGKMTRKYDESVDAYQVCINVSYQSYYCL